jgi:ABC-type transport system substrate-binding protein
MKQFHEDFADAAALEKMIEEEEVGSWSRLWEGKNNHGTMIEMPVMAPFVLTTQSDTLSTWRSNAFYMSTDPEGNQLPYIDGVQSIRVESREVAVFRTMAGETDMSGLNYLIREIPLYRSNMDRAGIEIKSWPLPGPGDMGLVTCQTCNQDAETGKWFRTRDFRTALSHAFDREAMNDTVYLGMGVPKNWVPHPSTPYYPGDKWAFDAIEFDQDKANRMLDDLGLTAKDDQGFRLRTDGSGDRLSFRVFSELVNSDDVTELLVDYFAGVGIEYKHKAQKSPWTVTYPGKEALLVGRIVGNYGANPWFSSWTRCCGTGGGPVFSPDISDLDRSMKRGPNGAVPTEGGYTPRCDCTMDPDWKPTAPADTFPADPSGNIAWLQDNWHLGKGFARLSPERVEIGKKVFAIHAEEKYYNIFIAHSGFWRGTIINRTNFKNVPDTHVADTRGFYGELYYFTDGLDNIRK